MKWDPADRAKVLAFAMEQATRCDMCGTAPWEWEDNKFAYTAIEEFCQGCYRKSVFQDQESTSLAGTNVKLVPTTKMMTAKAAVKARKRALAARKDRQEDKGGRHKAS